MCNYATLVSIHASSREDATSHCKSSAGSFWFQSTRPRGRTRPESLRIEEVSGSFNPRVLAGGRDILSDTRRHLMTVSIHASSREDATRKIRQYFIEVEFQSTRPRGRTRPMVFLFFLQEWGFNPRVLAGGRDFRNFTSVMLVVVSIHASSREDATLSSIACIAARVFQSTRPRGRTRQLANLPVSSSKVSIHASSREDATHLPPNPGYKNDVSIHASSREDATCACRPDLPAGLVSIHASSREDATCLWHGAPEPAPSFNPRVLAGGRDGW